MKFIPQFSVNQIQWWNEMHESQVTDFANQEIFLMWRTSVEWNPESRVRVSLVLI